MQVPLEISYKNVDKVDWLEDFIQRQVDRLQRHSRDRDLISCRVAVEQDHARQQRGNPNRIRIEVSIPGKKRLVTTAEPKVVQKDSENELRNVIRDAFRAMEKRLKKTLSERRHDTKTHEEPRALVTVIFPEEGYGFLKETESDEEIYFHKNSVLHNDFDRLTLGTEVRYEAELGEEGLQATSVQIVSKPGSRISPEGGDVLDVPEGRQPR
ncbi:MAG: cold shock domain-containing protein [Desulfohalobiaceae bacterium]|nr:cold shock domain-containing protein [Desulfohalobiaceae bacterium]